MATFAAFVSTVSDFLEAAIHQIVYERNIYPKDLFHNRSKFGIATKASRHSQVNKWINDAVKAVSEELLKVGGTLRAITRGHKPPWECE